MIDNPPDGRKNTVKIMLGGGVRDLARGDLDSRANSLGLATASSKPIQTSSRLLYSVILSRDRRCYIFHGLPRLLLRETPLFLTYKDV